MVSPALIVILSIGVLFLTSTISNPLTGIFTFTVHVAVLSISLRLAVIVAVPALFAVMVIFDVAVSPAVNAASPIETMLSSLLDHSMTSSAAALKEAVSSAVVVLLSSSTKSTVVLSRETTLSGITETSVTENSLR